MAHVAPYLLFTPGQQDHGPVAVGAELSPLRLGEVAVLSLEIGEILGAAGNQNFKLECPPFTLGAGFSINNELEQIVGEDLAIGLGKFDKDFVQAIEDDHGALRHPAVDIGQGVPLA